MLSEFKSYIYQGNILQFSLLFQFCFLSIYLHTLKKLQELLWLPKNEV